MSPHLLLTGALPLALAASVAAASPSLFPAPGATDVNPDTRLTLTFDTPPTVGDHGQIRIIDTADGRIVDTLDLALPPGPTAPNRTPAPYIATPYDYTAGAGRTNANTRPGTPSGGADPTSDAYQLTIIGGLTDGFHFYPVIIRDRTATIQPHHNLLTPGRTYRVELDPSVLTVADGSFAGIHAADTWTFTTRTTPPPADAARYVVAADGSGDFNTVQGALDFLPDHGTRPVTIFIKNGVYEEIVYFRNKAHVTLRGESRDGVIIRYANNEVFNPHPTNISTNEWPGTFPSRRAAFAADNVTDVHLAHLTIESLNDRPAQAEGLLLVGERNTVEDVTIIGSGDALQVNGSAYFLRSSVRGFGDNILGRGPAFFQDCEFITEGGPHMWIRNTAANHGNVFVDCTFRSLNGKEAVISRAPTNKGRDYPYSEAVLIDCRLDGIRPEGWGAVAEDVSNVHYWEFNSTRLDDGSPVDTSQRHPASRQLTLPTDADLIARYRDPTFVLDGWSPPIAP